MEKVRLKKEYPNTIQCSCTDVELRGGCYIDPKMDSFINDDYVEYTRSDLVKGLLDKEYKRGFEEGFVFGSNDWHKYPDEKPPIFDEDDKTIGRRYLVTLKIQYPFEEEAEYKVLDKIYMPGIEKWFITECETVLAWQELPEPFKED